VRAALGAVAVLGLLFAGCGGDDEDEPTGQVGTTAADTAPAPPVTAPPPETTPMTAEEPEPEAAPRVPPQEEQGDEEAIRSEAVFTGKGGSLSPREIRVPAFIAIRVILRASDAGRDRPYVLRIGGTRLAIGHTGNVAEADLDGLLPNRAYRGRSPQGDVRITATAEPGP
jgi:hypothetical protein